MNAKEKAYLVLADGRVYSGVSMGAVGEAIGEVVFTTGMTGYLETLTDPSYFGQIATQTFPLIGNYGINLEDAESDKVHMRGYIVRDWCEMPSNFRSQTDIDTYLKSQNVVGICQIDTRHLTKSLREFGVCNGAITNDISDKQGLLARINAYKIQDALQAVSNPIVSQFGEDDAPYKVVLLDYGYKRNLLRALRIRNCQVVVVAHDTTAEQVLAYQPDGILLSNGPGDPAQNPLEIAQLKQLAKSGVPIFGIGVGHQLLALAMGATTHKLKHGHRGANQPAKNLATGKVYITAQNHGYAVDCDTVDESIGKITFANVNDNTCEGIEYSTFPAFSVQFYPESCAGQADAMLLFDQFLNLIMRCKQCR